MAVFDFVYPGDLSTRTGGYRYARRMLAALERRGVTARLHRLADSFPFPDADALAHAGAVLAGIPDASTVVVDGLAFGAMAQAAASNAARLKLIALVHHPLALETGLDVDAAQDLAASERAALDSACAVIVTSPATAAALHDYGVSPARITVVLPGTDRPLSPRSPPSPPSPAGAVLARAGRTPAPDSSGPVSLLCVASLTPRKGHRDLVEALGALRSRNPAVGWQLACIGSLERDAACVTQLRARIAALGLDAQVTLAGERDEAGVDRAYAQSDVFVLASHHEGYGMVLAEALAHGLPVVSTTAGAIPDTVPAAAGLLVPPGDVAALCRALEKVIGDPALRSSLSAAALAAADSLPGWDASAERFLAVLRAPGGSRT